MKIKKGDRVVVTTGKDIHREGEVIRCTRTGRRCWSRAST